MDESYKLADIIINFRNYKNYVECNDTYYRTLLSILIDREILLVNDNCNQLDIPNNSKMIKPGGSASLSLQWLDVIEFARLNKNTHKIKMIASNICNIFSMKTNEKEYLIDKIIGQNKIKIHDNIIFTIFDTNDEKKIYNYLSIRLDEIITEFSKSKKFLKLNAISLNKSNVMTMDSIKAYTETNNYKLLQRLIIEHYTPHVSAYFYSTQCNTSMTQYINNKNINTGFSNTTIKNYFNNILLNRGQILFGYNFLITEMIDGGYSFYDLINRMKAGQKQINERDVIKMLFQIVYTLNIFSQYKFVHADMHLGNVYIEPCNKEYTNFYIITDSAGDIIKIVEIKSTYTVKIIDFDLSFFISSIDNNNNLLKENYPVSHIHKNENLLEKYDLFYFFKNLNIEIIKQYPFIYRLVKDFLYIKSISPDLFNKMDMPCSNNTQLWAIPPDIFKSQIKNSYTTIEAMNYFLNLNQQSLNGIGITLYDNLENIVFQDNSQIYFYPNANLNKLKEGIRKNQSWNSLTSAQKYKICYPLVDVVETISNMKQEVIEIVNNAPNNIQGGNYYHKYLKYKNKYTNFNK